MTNYSLIILKRIYLFASVTTHQLALTVFVSMYSRGTRRQGVILNHVMILLIVEIYHVGDVLQTLDKKKKG